MLNLVTGRTGSAHVTSGQFRDMIRGMVGPDEYFGTDGSRMEISKVSNTIFTVGSGTAYKNGCVFNIPYGSFENVNIDTETSGYERTDAVVVRWTVDGDGIESAELKVIKGTPTTGSANNPSVIDGNIQEGSTTADMLIGYVHIAKDGAAQVQTINKKIPGLDLLYPVGSIYQSVSNTDPSNVFGGVWQSWGAGRVPVGVNTSDTAFNAVEKTGGEKTHTITADEMPAHNHEIATFMQGSDLYSIGSIRIDKNTAYKYNTSTAGGGKAMNNLQPYITCYFWKRVK